MNAFDHRTLVLALGNDLLGDDGVGLSAARLLREQLKDEVAIVECEEAGLALLDLFVGYERMLLLDAVLTGTCAPGTVLEIAMSDFPKIAGSSPHYVGLPEVIEMAEQLGMHCPKEVRILALEVESLTDFREGLSPPVASALAALVERARQVVEEWGSNSLCMNTH
jgi:hydrogenase maturation protease